MIKLEEIIGNLLLRHNCVIIPGFGGFVAQKTSAKIDYKTGIISPPGKSLLFNRQLINNDGLLISEFAQQKGISYNDSLSSIDQLVAQWNTELSAGNRISIDKVGFLFFDQERNICFEQDRYFNLLLSSYGLGSVHFLTETDVAIAQHKIEVMEQPVIAIDSKIAFASEKDVIQPSETVISIPEKQQTEIKTVPVVNKKSNFWKYAAAACAIPVLFYSMWIPMKTDVLESKIISFQDFNPFHQQEKAVYDQQPVEKFITSEDEQIQTLEEQLQSVESNESTYSYNLTEDTYILVKFENRTEATAKQPVAETQQAGQKYSSVSNEQAFNYIVGCFSDEKNAENLVKELKAQGFNAFIKDKKGGLSRVSVGSAGSADELNQIIVKATAAGHNGWILK